MDIDSRALVHPRAKIGPGTKIGPDAIVGEEVETGPDCEIRARAVLTGRVVLGARNQIGYGAVIGAEPQDLSYKGAATSVRIGDDNVIREYCTIHRGTKEGSETVLGSGCFLMVGAHVAHNCRVGDQAVLVNNVLLGGYAEVGDHAFVGGGSVVHQNTRVGAYAMIRGLTQVAMDVPPYCMMVILNAVCGLNRVGLKRKGFDMERRRRLQELYGIYFESGLNRLQALERIAVEPGLQHPDVDRFVAFVSSTKRGICRGIKAADLKEE